MELAVELRNVSKVYAEQWGAGRSFMAVKDLSLGIQPSEFFTLLGPSGCGKTTTLRMIAGFEVVTSGELLIQGRPMQTVPPNKRPVNTVFQNYALFPHLTVTENVAFGLAVQRVPRAERERRAAEALELVRLPGLGDRRPNQLSGGQQQRVALARALVNRPAVLLLDEPLGALDLKLRKEMQLELKQLQSQVGITFIYVTHDQEEALTMSNRIGVMNRGELLQVGDPVTIYENPATRFVADFIGETNFFVGIVQGMNARTALVAVAGQSMPAQAGEPVTPGQVVTVTIRPEKVKLARADGSENGRLTGVIADLVYIGTDTRYLAELPSGDKVVARIQNIGRQGLGEYHLGDHVTVDWSPADARVLTA